MCSKTAKERIAILSCVLFFLFRLAARLTSVAHSSAATNILYMDGSLPTVLSLVRQAFLVAAVGTAVAGLSASGRETAKRISLGMTWCFCLVIFADAASAFLIDVCSGAVQGVTMWMALAVNMVSLLAESVFVWVVYAISRSKKQAHSPAKTVLLASAVHLIWYLALETTYLIQFLNENGFFLSASLTLEIVLAYLDIVLWQGGAVWLVAMLLLRVWRGKKNKIHP